MATLKGTWRFNGILSAVSTDVNQSLIFHTSNGVLCTALNRKTDGLQIVVDTGASYYAYVDVRETWDHPVSQTIIVPNDQEVSNEFYEWFTANATRIDEEETPIATITYKGETLETLNGGEYVTLHTKGQMMEDDIRVEVAAIAISEDSPLPIEIATEEEMTALLDTAEVGSVYKYTGETDTFENGALYVVEESE